MQLNFSQAALGMSSAAVARAGLYFQFDNLQKSVLKVETAEKNVTSAEATLVQARISLRALTEKEIR